MSFLNIKIISNGEKPINLSFFAIAGGIIEYIIPQENPPLFIKWGIFYLETFLGLAVVSINLFISISSS